MSDATSNALRALRLAAARLDESSVALEVLSEGTRGLLGVGATPARVAASGRELEARPGAAERSLPAEQLYRLVERVTATIGVVCEIEIEEAPAQITATCTGDDLGRLIGRRGQTLDALQLLAAAALQRREPGKTVIVDADGYRGRRRERLEQLARSVAQSVRDGGKRVTLEPMPPAERKLVHTYLAAEPGVATTSEGVEPYRYVVVEPA